MHTDRAGVAGWGNCVRKSALVGRGVNPDDSRRAVAGFGIQEAPSAPQGFRRISALARLAMSRR
jgi:hypothetical protein